MLYSVYTVYSVEAGGHAYVRLVKGGIHSNMTNVFESLKGRGVGEEGVLPYRSDETFRTYNSINVRVRSFYSKYKLFSCKKGDNKKRRKIEYRCESKSTTVKLIFNQNEMFEEL